MLLFGWLANLYGQKRMYGIELMIISVSTVGRLLPDQAPELEY